MVYQGATGLYHFLINVIPFISNSVHEVDTIKIIHNIRLWKSTKCSNGLINSNMETYRLYKLNTL